MQAPISITTRDRDLINSLGYRVRLLSLSQVSRGFFDGDDRQARRRVKQLASLDLLAVQTTVTRQVPAHELPLATWEPGQGNPPFSSLAKRLRQRWSKRPSVSETIVTLGDRSLGTFGLRRSHSIKHALQVGHDLAVSEVFLRYQAHSVERIAFWFCEDAWVRLDHTAKGRGRVIPDAILSDAAGEPVRAIEIGGLYSPERLRNLHLAFAERRLRYELW